MSSVDERVVDMKFNNSQFEQGAKKSIDTLGLLSKSLKMDGAKKGLDEVSASASRFSLQNIAQGVQDLGNRFTNLGVVAISALTNITNRAVNAGISIAKSLTIDPIKQGLQEYETNLNSVQTILANTSAKGTNLQQVNAALAELNTYSDKTIYNFGEMARNIGTFTAAGVDLKTSTNAIKGIANLAAVSGSNSQQASTAMYQLSQALAAGKISLMDWNSVVNAGMGGEVFQKALKDTARASGVAIDSIIKQSGSFRGSLEKGWLTSDILTKTLSKFTGDMTDAQLAAQGYTKAQIAEIQAMAKTAQEAATKVKTVTQLMDTLKEASGSGWSQTWQIVLGDFEEARDLFTKVSDRLGGLINASSDARNKILQDWKKLGGRTDLIFSVTNVFEGLMDILGHVGKAFTDIFPPVTGKQLAEISRQILFLSQRFSEFSDNYGPQIGRTFKGVFAVLDIVRMVIVAAATAFGKLFGVATEGAGGILNFTASIGDFLVKLRDAIKNGNGLTTFFETLAGVLAYPIVGLKNLIGLIAAFASGLGSADTKGMENGLKNIAKRFEPIAAVGGLAQKAWEGALKIFGRVATTFAPLAGKISQEFSKLGKAIVASLTNMDFTPVLDVVNTGLFAGLVVLIKKLVDGLGDIDISGGIIDSIKGTFGALTDTLGAMQANLKANALLKIGAAIGLLAVSVLLLASIDSAALTKALLAITVMFTQLFGAMAIFEKIAGSKGFLQMPALAASLILLGVALLILAAAVKVLSTMSWEELAKGLGATAALLAMLAGAVKLMSGNTKGMITAGIGLLLLSVGIKILADAVKSMAELSWEELAKGLVGVGGLLVSLALFTKFAQASKGSIGSAVGLLIMAVAINVLAKAMEAIAQLSWEGIAKSLVAMTGALALMAAALLIVPPSSVAGAIALIGAAAALLIVGEAMNKFAALSWEGIGKAMVSMFGALLLMAAALIVVPPSSVASAIALIGAAAALAIVADVMAKMGAMSWESIGKAMVAMAGSLGIISVAMLLMTGALPGAAALLVVAAALRIFAPVLQTLGSMPVEQIVQGLVALAGVFAVLGLAGLLLTPTIPTLLGLGVAIGLIGIGVAAAGAGVLMFALGLTALAAAGAGAAVAIVAIIMAILGTLPAIVQAIGATLVAIAHAIIAAAPVIVAAIVVVLLALINGIIKLIPKVADALIVLIDNLVRVLVTSVPRLVDGGLRLIVGILTGIRNNIGRIVTVALEIIANFITGIANGIPKVINAGVDLIIKFVDGVANAIRNNSERMGSAGANLATAIVEGMARGIAGGVGTVISAAKRMATDALAAAKSALGINSPSREFAKLGMGVDEGMSLGIDKFSHLVTNSTKDVAKDAISTMKKSIVDISKVVDSNLDANPVIRPVLDLSAVTQGAATLGKLMPNPKIDVSGSYSKAKDASVTYESEVGLAAGSSSSVVNNIEFVQNNTSPKALSPAEIYRQTNSQLSLAKKKGALTP